MLKTSPFKTIGIMGKPNAPESSETYAQLIDILKNQKRHFVVEERTAELISTPDMTIVPRAKLGEACDLVIVVGGDGSLLNTARAIINTKTPVVGINRGGLGFLTDIGPHEVAERIPPILAGQFVEEERFLIQATVYRQDNVVGSSIALNDTVLYTGDIARMMEFEVTLDEQFVYSLRSDGIIVATPTGSTAYALSGGGPILQPWLNTMVLVPMHPHTLTSRPIVVDGKSKVSILINPNNDIHPRVSCDGQIHISCQPGDTIKIERYAKTLRLFHPSDYDYYQVLRSKLSWGTRLSAPQVEKKG